MFSSGENHIKRILKCFEFEYFLGTLILQVSYQFYNVTHYQIDCKYFNINLCIIVHPPFFGLLFNSFQFFIENYLSVYVKIEMIKYYNTVELQFSQGNSRNAFLNLKLIILVEREKCENFTQFLCISSSSESPLNFFKVVFSKV